MAVMTGEEIQAEIDNMQSDIKNHCPFGCQREHLDEHGYCAHLMGFTNDGKVFEVVSTNPHGRTCVLGNVTEADESDPKRKKLVRNDHRQPVLPTDTIINPESVVIADGTKHHVKAWSSSRVYRKVKPQAKAS